MNIEVINYDQFLDFAQANTQFNVLQSIEHAQRMHKHYEYIALIEDQEIKAAGLFGFIRLCLSAVKFITATAKMAARITLRNPPYNSSRM